MKPKIIHAEINSQSEAVVNASEVVELARSTDTAQARRVLAADHEAEAEIAARNPSLPEKTTRADAVLTAFRLLNVRIVTV
jgi:hypothetical protein